MKKKPSAAPFDTSIPHRVVMVVGQGDGIPVPMTDQDIAKTQADDAANAAADEATRKQGKRRNAKDGLDVPGVLLLQQWLIDELNTLRAAAGLPLLDMQTVRKKMIDKVNAGTID